MEKRDIEIRRNIIEKSLMTVKEYIRKNSRVVLYAAAGVLAGILILIAAILFYEKKATNELVQLEQILDTYRQSYSGDASMRLKALDSAVKDLNALTGKSWWGYVKKNGYYVIGGLLYNERRFAEAKKYFLKFVDGSPRSFFSPLALQQAARSAQYLNDYKAALNIYKRLEKDYTAGAVGDQVFYDMGSAYEHEGDTFKARENYNRVITSYSRSPFAQKAKEKLLLLGISGKKD